MASATVGRHPGPPRFPLPRTPRRKSAGAETDTAARRRGGAESPGAEPEGSGPAALRLDGLTQGRSGVVRKVRSGARRAVAWSIFPRRDPRVEPETGEGHRFLSRAVGRDWCDACGRQVSAEALQCRNCSYTCHLECQGLVQLDCNQRDKQSEETASSPAARDTNVTKEEDEEEEKPKLSEEEIMTKIEEYNSKISENGMKLSPDGSYTGFIKVHLKLRRPVTVQAQSDSDPGGPGRTSFYLPNDAVKQLHISSTTTVSEVIQGLLNKFRVVDNAHKFALYQQTHCSGQDLLQKLLITEHPLYLRLVMGPNPENLSFVLKENETGEVEWDAFSVPELHNFLTILEKEESERVRQVRRRYVTYRERLLQALQDVQTKPD